MTEEAVSLGNVIQDLRNVIKIRNAKVKPSNNTINSLMKENGCIKRKIYSSITTNVSLQRKAHELTNSNHVDDHGTFQKNVIAMHECL